MNHSDAKLLFVGDVVATQVDATRCRVWKVSIYIPDYSLVVSRTDKLTYAASTVNETVSASSILKSYRKNHVNYYTRPGS